MTEAVPEVPKQFIICAPEDWDHTSNSILIDAECGHRVWIAPSGQRVMEAGGIAYCVPCAMPLIREHKVPPAAAPGVLADIEEDQGGWERKKVEAFFNRAGISHDG